METKRLIELMKSFLDQALKEEIHSLKKEIIISNSRVDLLENKLGVAYEELARTKEEVMRIVS